MKQLKSILRSVSLHRTLRCVCTHLQTSLALEKVDVLMTSGAIQAYVPAADIRVVLLVSRASPKSVILSVLKSRSSLFPSISSRIRAAIVVVDRLIEVA